jgi:WXXGXW repeat (2 copies)
MTAVVAPYAPPPPRVETPPPAPSTLATWQPGHWFWNGTRYDWMPGHYVDRPAQNANWMPGYWQQEPNGWTWIEGRWS